MDKSRIGRYMGARCQPAVSRTAALVLVGRLQLAATGGAAERAAAVHRRHRRYPTSLCAPAGGNTAGTRAAASARLARFVPSLSQGHPATVAVVSHRGAVAAGLRLHRANREAIARATDAVQRAAA